MRICVGCLRECKPKDPSFDPGNPWGDLNLKRCTALDVDEHGKERPSSVALVCESCRCAALATQLLVVLAGCAYGGPVRGVKSLWHGFSSPNFSYEDYVGLSTGTAIGVAQNVVEEQWLGDHTRWDELMYTALEMQRYERRLMRRYVYEGRFETSYERERRRNQSLEIRGDDDRSVLRFDQDEMRALYENWARLAHNDNLPEEESNDEDSDYEEATLEPKVGVSL